MSLKSKLGLSDNAESTTDRIKQLVAIAKRRYIDAVTVVFLLVILIAQIQIVSRQLPREYSQRFLWTGELATNLLVFTIFFGAAAAELQGDQITVTVIRDRIVGVIGPAYRILLDLLTLGFVGAVIYGSYFQMLDGMSREGAVIHWFRAGYLFGFLMAAFVIIFFTLLIRTLFTLRREIAGGVE